MVLFLVQLYFSLKTFFYTFMVVFSFEALFIHELELYFYLWSFGLIQYSTSFIIVQDILHRINALKMEWLNGFENTL